MDFPQRYPIRGSPIHTDVILEAHFVDSAIFDQDVGCERRSESFCLLSVAGRCR